MGYPLLTLETFALTLEKEGNNLNSQQHKVQAKEKISKYKLKVIEIAFIEAINDKRLNLIIGWL